MNPENIKTGDSWININFGEFMDLKNEEELEVAQMVRSGEAYYQDEKDKNGNINWIKIFKNDGTLVFFKDIKGLHEYKAKDSKEN